MWKSVLLALIAGLLFVLSWPTNGFPLLVFFAFIPLLLIERQFSEAEFGKKGLKIFGLSLFTFLIFNALTYSWLSHAHPETDATSSELQQAWFAYLFAVIVNSLLMSLAFLFFHKIRLKFGNFLGYAFLPMIWIFLEKLHLNWDFAWPWLNLGNAFASFHKWVQWYSVTGALGGTLWVILVNEFLFLGINSFLEHQKAWGKKMLILGIFTMLLPIGGSYIMYNNYVEKSEQSVEVVLLQPKLDPYREKYQLSGDQILMDLLNLAQKGITDSTQFVIVPETAFPGLDNVVLNDVESDYYIQRIKEFVRYHPQVNFISGMDAVKFFNQEEMPNPTAIEMRNGGWLNHYNAVAQMNTKDSVQTYFKSKLVVGVELFPYMSVLKPLLGDAMLDFGGSVNSLTTQEERSVFSNTLNNGKVAPLVCYESIFGEFVSEFVKNGANFISVSTNDSWWGNTQGHKQFLEYAKLRAIENRRDVVRAANSGISAFINQRGDIVKSLPYDEKGFLRGEVHLNSELTPYTKSGDVVGRIALILAGVMTAFYFMSLILKKKN
ncbi:apolipoprotein N-acyltransferase [Ornithobacterium rhinotracheale]|uniref:apolipoprotein N-acyltransferase n=1 Tax=Ornithobacterium rhinotracheale TaxID=28251 RepID=UPI001FF1D7EC|nr:apolipoprotein N-acyltransferase [Ornithobacterium rhinotracheale]MCK0203165.1 apolipoprotein N-acyltransferase [Ornithobacterium rhinotracheale]